MRDRAHRAAELRAVDDVLQDPHEDEGDDEDDQQVRGDRRSEKLDLLFLEQFANPLVYMLIGAAGIKGYFKGMVDAAVIVAVLLLMAINGFVQEMMARRAMEAPLKLSAPRTKVRRDGAARIVDTAEVVPGDILVLEAGDRIAADARLLEIANLRINESALTGESLPVEK